MPFPVAAAIGLGASALGGLFGRRRKRRGYTPPPFSYSPDESDAELLLRRRRALEEISRGKGSAINEIGRAGLLGSSAAFGVLGEQEAAGQRGLEDITSDVFAKRRMEALQLYRDQQEFERQLALGEQAQQGRESLLGLESLGDIGALGGGALEEYLRKRRALRGESEDMFPFESERIY